MERHFRITLKPRGERNGMPERDGFLKEIRCTYDGFGWTSGGSVEYMVVIPDSGVKDEEMSSIPSRYPFVEKVEAEK